MPHKPHIPKITLSDPTSGLTSPAYTKKPCPNVAPTTAAWPRWHTLAARQKIASGLPAQAPWSSDEVGPPENAALSCYTAQEAKLTLRLEAEYSWIDLKVGAVVVAAVPGETERREEGVEGVEGVEVGEVGEVGVVQCDDTHAAAAGIGIDFEEDGAAIRIRKP